MPRSRAAASRPLPSAEHWGALLVIAPLAVAALRQAGEVILGVGWPDGPVLQNDLVFYLATELAMLWLLRLTTGSPMQELAPFVALGLLLGVLPPILDGLLFRQAGVNYVYFDAFRWLFWSREQPLGETVCVWLSLVAAGAFAGWVTRRAGPAILAFLGAYAWAQVLGSGLARLVYRLIPEQHGPRVLALHLLLLAVGLTCLVALRPRALGGSCRRLSHALPFVCVTALAARLSGDHWLLAAIKASVTLLASLPVIATNDWYDRFQDGGGREPRPMEVGDLWLLAAFQLLLGLTVAWFLREAAVGIALFLATTLAYHHPATRLKRRLGLGYSAEGLAALACFLIGALRPAPPFLPSGGPVAWGLALVPTGFLLGSIFKDYKDVEDDRLAGVQTAYTALARRGIAPRLANRLVAALLALCLLTSAALVHAAGAGLPATALLLALGAMAALGLLVGTPEAAVERTIWVVSAFLLVAAISLPSPARPGAARFPYASPGVCRSMR